MDFDFDDRKCISRIVVRKSDFAKIIGKGGAMVNQIKAKCGASIKGTEVDDENRIVIFDFIYRYLLTFSLFPLYPLLLNESNHLLVLFDICFVFRLR